MTLSHFLSLTQSSWSNDLVNKLSRPSTGGPSSSCEMIILRNNGHGGIIRVCMGIFTSALRNKKIRQILKKNTSPRFHSLLLVIWLLTLMKRAPLSELFISRFSTHIRKALLYICMRPFYIYVYGLRARSCIECYALATDQESSRQSTSLRSVITQWM